MIGQNASAGAVGWRDAMNRYQCKFATDSAARLITGRRGALQRQFEKITLKVAAREVLLQEKLKASIELNQHNLLKVSATSGDLAPVGWSGARTNGTLTAVPRWLKHPLEPDLMIYWVKLEIYYCQ
ncbi:hypothetical protein EVAR_26745_1 [Eumeta japonica]|uniref:Uncharacterized protein n=1 Tax=Eumeta variegata TaxID=151549 RepID=A0A4C2A7N5_EUMVA|nr:hypothetical protein EVAR_26745_1 [Eumeta japonica]